jgi:hypothetical protein
MLTTAHLTAERVTLTVTAGPTVDGGHRRRWTYTIAVDGKTVHTGSDLEGHVADDADQMLGHLAGFLYAWQESRAYYGSDGENAGLFPEALWGTPVADEAEWLYALTQPEGY